MSVQFNNINNLFSKIFTYLQQNCPFYNFIKKINSTKNDNFSSENFDLSNNLSEFLGVDTVAFKALFNAIEPIWDTCIVTVLIASFGEAKTLYVIFYAGILPNEIMMEIWDPIYLNKQSQFFKLKLNFENLFLPKNRSEAKVLQLQNWY